MKNESKKVLIELTSDEALVLFEFLARFSDREILETGDQAEKRALWNLHALLEKQLVEPFDSGYQKLLKKARARLKDSTD
jgi:hypothetical protein